MTNQPDPQPRYEWHARWRAAGTDQPWECCGDLPTNLPGALEDIDWHRTAAGYGMEFQVFRRPVGDWEPVTEDDARAAWAAEEEARHG